MDYQTGAISALFKLKAYNTILILPCGMLITEFCYNAMQLPQTGVVLHPTSMRLKLTVLTDRMMRRVVQHNHCMGYGLLLKSRLRRPKKHDLGTPPALFLLPSPSPLARGNNIYPGGQAPLASSTGAAGNGHRGTRVHNHLF